ncbi:MAG: nucleotidyltransferase [Phycisphaerae bacterium SM23_33]|jgi:predicted nucleotidyltransferase|nr:MAG: nucleotidyltransferase [Phycisphaerae bacterium SM23_33]
MDKEAVLKIARRFQQALLARGVKASKIILYGSYAKGEHHEGSDIDLVVISNDFADKDYWHRIDVLSDAIYELWEPIEAVAMTPEEWERGDSMIVQLAKDGELLYSA